MNVKSVNKKWIFWNDDTSEKATEPKLREIMEAAKADGLFYSRMQRELVAIYDKAKLNLDHGRPCPTWDDIRRAPIGENSELSVYRESYLQRLGGLSGISEAIQEISNRNIHAIQVETQCRMALGIERPNINEMYPEMRKVER